MDIKPAYAIMDLEGQLMSLEQDFKMTEEFAKARIWGTPRGAENRLKRFKDVINNNRSWQNLIKKDFNLTPADVDTWEIVTIYARIVR